jgi:hypothetical protein
VAHDLASAITENGLADEQRATAEVAAVFSLGGALLKKTWWSGPERLTRTRQQQRSRRRRPLPGGSVRPAAHIRLGGLDAPELPPPAPQATKPTAAALALLRRARRGYRCDGCGGGASLGKCA